MSTQPDVLVIGGGVIGLTTAYFLAREGIYVEIVDKGDFGQEASWAGAGILPPGNLQQARTPFEQLRAHSAALFPRLSAELRDQTGVDNGYLRCGGLEFTKAASQEAAQEWRTEGIAFEVVDGKGLAHLEPALCSELQSAYYLPDMAQVRNPRHLKALLAGCQSLGVRLQPGCPVSGFETRGQRVTAVRTNQGLAGAGRFLLAAGAWSDGLLQSVGWQPGVHPIRGQIVLINTGVPLFRRILLWGTRYLVPRPDGRVLVGSTEEDAGFDKRTTSRAIGDLLALACHLVPGLAEAPVEHCWAGLRPGSPDGLPFLGPVPGFENLFIAAGHFRAGIQLSPATGLGMKELLLGQPQTISLESFRPDRIVAAIPTRVSAGYRPTRLS
jgi:glycine oxidase